jgi:hypothetical protein
LFLTHTMINTKILEDPFCWYDQFMHLPFSSCKFAALYVKYIGTVSTSVSKFLTEIKIKCKSKDFILFFREYT